MFEYFYNEILRRTIISFGTLFNDISIKNEGSVVKVPLAYGPTQKFLARLEQSPDLNKSTAMSLPRMSFEFIGLTYDPSRKITTTQKFVVKDPSDGSEVKKSYVPVPYNMQFELSVMTKLNDDMLQIVEQILPYFQPAYNLTVELVETIKEKRDVPVVLENITMEDDYEGDYTSQGITLHTKIYSKNISFWTCFFCFQRYYQKTVSYCWKRSRKCSKISHILRYSKSNQKLYWTCSNYIG